MLSKFSGCNALLHHKVVRQKIPQKMKSLQRRRGSLDLTNKSRISWSAVQSFTFSYLLFEGFEVCWEERTSAKSSAVIGSSESGSLGRDIETYPFGNKMYLDVWLCLATGLFWLELRSHKLLGGYGLPQRKLRTWKFLLILTFLLRLWNRNVHKAVHVQRFAPTHLLRFRSWATLPKVEDLRRSERNRYNPWSYKPVWRIRRVRWTAIRRMTFDKDIILSDTLIPFFLMCGTCR